MTSVMLPRCFLSSKEYVSELGKSRAFFGYWASLQQAAGGTVAVVSIDVWYRVLALLAILFLRLLVVELLRHYSQVKLRLSGCIL